MVDKNGNAVLWLIPGTAILLLKFTQLADKQKFAVFWQRPDLVIDEFLEFIDRSAHCVETFGNLVICNGLAVFVRNLVGCFAGLDHCVNLGVDFAYERRDFADNLKFG